MSIIKIHHGRFFQRQTAQGYALVGVFQADVSLQEAHEYVAHYDGEHLRLDPQAVSGDEALRHAHYDDSTVGGMLTQPIWKTTADPAFFTIRTIAITGRAYLVYAARRQPFFNAQIVGDQFFDLSATGLVTLSAPVNTLGCSVDQVVREPIWPLTPDDAANQQFASIEPTSTPLLERQNQVKALFLQVKRGEISQEQAFELLGRNDYMLNSILKDKAYSTFLLNIACIQPLKTARFIPVADLRSKEQSLAELVKALI